MVERRSELLNQDRELYAAVNVVPWSIDDPAEIPKHGGELASGHEACDEERSVVKRRDRQFNHMSENSERQADFRARLRETKMSSASDESSFSSRVSVLTIGKAPLLPVLSVRADYLSSYFESIAQWESGGMEFAAPCSFIPEVSENEETWRARNAELVRLVEFQAKKSGMLNCGLCMHPFGGRHEQTKESAVSLTSGALICKTTLVLDGNHGWSMSFSDNSCVSLSALIKDLWFAASLVVYLNPISEILCGVKLVRLTMEPAAFWSKRSRVLVHKHMVDGALVGPDDVTRKWTTVLS